MERRTLLTMALTGCLSLGLVGCGCSSQEQKPAGNESTTSNSGNNTSAGNNSNGNPSSSSTNTPNPEDGAMVAPPSAATPNVPAAGNPVGEKRTLDYVVTADELASITFNEMYVDSNGNLIISVSGENKANGKTQVIAEAGSFAVNGKAVDPACSVFIPRMDRMKGGTIRFAGTGITNPEDVTLQGTLILGDAYGNVLNKYDVSL